LRRGGGGGNVSASKVAAATAARIIKMQSRETSEAVITTEYSDHSDASENDTAGAKSSTGVQIVQKRKAHTQGGRVYDGNDSDSDDDYKPISASEFNNNKRQKIMTPVSKSAPARQSSNEQKPPKRTAASLSAPYAARYFPASDSASEDSSSEGGAHTPVASLGSSIVSEDGTPVQLKTHPGRAILNEPVRKIVTLQVSRGLEHYPHSFATKADKRLPNPFTSSNDTAAFLSTPHPYGTDGNMMLPPYLPATTRGPENVDVRFMSTLLHQSQQPWQPHQSLKFGKNPSFFQDLLNQASPLMQPSYQQGYHQLQSPTRSVYDLNFSHSMTELPVYTNQSTLSSLPASLPATILHANSAADTAGPMQLDAVVNPFDPASLTPISNQTWTPQLVTFDPPLDNVTALSDLPDAAWLEMHQDEGFVDYDPTVVLSPEDIELLKEDTYGSPHGSGHGTGSGSGGEEQMDFSSTFEL
jgi:hypothetical protein